MSDQRSGTGVRTRPEPGGPTPGSATAQHDATAPRDTEMMPAEQVLAKASAENFPVALRALPARYREHLMAVYLFARTVDDAGDLAPLPDRPRLLAGIEDDVRRLYAALSDPGAVPAREEPRLPAVRRLAAAVTDRSIPMQPFLDLIEANNRDQVVTRYQTYDELVEYCTLSANPVGRLVLYIFDAYTPERATLSDAICTGLQITEHLQDVAEDFGNGRVYLPAEDMRACDCDERDLTRSQASPALRKLIEFEADRAGTLIDSGAPLIASLRGAARVAVSGYVAGGRAALAAIAAARYDVLAATPRPRTARTAAELARAYLRAR